jgi:hypothetical protein
MKRFVLLLLLLTFGSGAALAVSDAIAERRELMKVTAPR